MARRKRTEKRIVLPAALALALAGFLLRLLQRSRTGSILPLCLLSLLALGYAAFVSTGLKPRARFRVNQQPTPALLALPNAALLLLAAAIAYCISLRGGSRILIGGGSFISAVLLGAIAFGTVLGNRPHPLLYMGITLALILKLIPEFRTWSTDPIISDYCFSLFAMLCVLLLSFYLGGFAMDCGKRRISVFFCIAGLYFCAVALPGSSAAACLDFLGYAVLLAAELWELLTHPRRRRRRIPQEADAE